MITMKSNTIGAVTAGLLCLAAAHAGSFEGGVGFGARQTLDVKEFLTEARTIKVSAAPRMMPTGNDPQAGKPGQAVEWVSISGGKFTMRDYNAYSSVHEITAFEMAKTMVTVEQYAECMIKGRCTEPATGGLCNWETRDGEVRAIPGREKHPANCVDWNQANQYAKFKDARLPNDTEWEYAARSEGKDRSYPWGDDAPTCDKAVIYGNGDFGCGSGGTMPVCSKPAGNTEQGLCDMAGNLFQWVQDKYQSQYRDPARGGAIETVDSIRAMRGGSFGYVIAGYQRVDFRYGEDADQSSMRVGFRLARSSR